MPSYNTFEGLMPFYNTFELIKLHSNLNYLTQTFIMQSGQSHSSIIEAFGS